MSLSELHRMDKRRREKPIRDLRDEIEKLNWKLESANDARRRAEFETMRVEAMMGSLFMERDGSGRYIDDYTEYMYGVKRISWAVALSRHELKGMIANPEILERVMQYNLRKLMQDFASGKWCDGSAGI